MLCSTNTHRGTPPPKKKKQHPYTSDLAFSGPDRLISPTADWSVLQPRTEQSEHNITSAESWKSNSFNKKEKRGKKEEPLF